MKSTLRSLAAIASVFLLLSCATTVRRAITGVTRDECMAIAEAYRRHVWRPSAVNVRHGPDADGIQVDTPDTSYRPGSFCPGYWTPGHMATGVPYQWGGFCTPEEFEARVRAGYAAGDVYTNEKRRLLEHAVSRFACGIDCSGFISRCWGLPRSFSTRELPALCDVIAPQDLQPGDILNTVNAHCILFGGWADASRTTFHAYHTGSPPHWRVVRHPISLPDLLAQGFVPLRYKQMQE